MGNEPKVGMRFGSYVASTKNLSKKYKSESYTCQKVNLPPATKTKYIDNQGNVVATSTDYHGKYNKLGFMGMGPFNSIESGGLIWEAGVNMFRKSRPEDAFDRIIGEKTYAQDGTINPNYKAKPGEKVVEMYDGIVQPWEIFDRNF